VGKRPTWPETWMTLADVMAERSRCVRAQIGAVIVSVHNRVISTGYNGPAATYPGEGPCSGFCARAQGITSLDEGYGSCPSIHAEANALLYVDRSAVEGGVIFVTGACCMDCAKLISNSGLQSVVMRVKLSDAHRRPADVIEYLEKCGLQVVVLR
jgi:dCMP deaminase